MMAPVPRVLSMLMPVLVTTASISARADEPAPSSVELWTRLRGIEDSDRATEGEAALGHARRALMASDSLAATDPAAAVRALRIAAAALDLAEARIRYAHERAAVVRVRERAALAQRRATEARAALDTVLLERGARPTAPASP